METEESTQPAEENITAENVSTFSEVRICNINNN